MALPANVQRTSYPLAAYNFRVKVAETSMSFTEVSGIAVVYDHIVYRHGLSFAEGEEIETFTFERFSPITCKRGTILGSSPLFLYDWLRARDLRSLEVSLCDEAGAPALSWKIAAAVPVSLKAPAFTAGTNDVVIDTLELQARGCPLSSTDLLLGFRFGVYFFAGGVVPNPLDIRFQKVKGLTATVKTAPLTEGGQNLYTQQLPTGVEYGNLVLERGMIIGSLLHIDFNAAMTLFKFATSNVLVTLFNDSKVPLSAWFFTKAYPVKWSTSDLDATQKNLLVDTLELAYARMQIMRI